MSAIIDLHAYIHTGQTFKQGDGVLPGKAYLVVHERVESLPVTLDLGGDVLVLENHAGCPPLPPL